MAATANCTRATVRTARGPPRRRTAVSPQQNLRTAQDMFIRRWGEMGQTWGINRTMARDPRAALHHRPAAVHGRRDGAAEHQPRQREHEPAGAVRLGHHPPAAQARRAAGVLREPRRRVGDVLASSPPSASAARWTRCWRRSASASRCSTSRASARPPPSSEDVQLTRQRLAGMEEFMEVTNKIFQQFVGNAQSGLTRVVKVLLKALGERDPPWVCSAECATGRDGTSAHIGFPRVALAERSDPCICTDRSACPAKARRIEGRPMRACAVPELTHDAPACAFVHS